MRSIASVFEPIQIAQPPTQAQRAHRDGRCQSTRKADPDSISHFVANLLISLGWKRPSFTIFFNEISAFLRTLTPLI
jgi:hypothetical protein